MNNTICKSCTENVKTDARISIDQINAALDRLSSSKSVKLVDDEVYRYRLSKCQDCKHLEFGYTCLQCGCIVQIRAKLVDAFCPFPKNNKWKPQDTKCK